MWLIKSSHCRYSQTEENPFKHVSSVFVAQLLIEGQVGFGQIDADGVWFIAFLSCWLHHFYNIADVCSPRNNKVILVIAVQIHILRYSKKLYSVGLKMFYSKPWKFKVI